MNEKIIAFQVTMLEWYNKNGRKFPWRKKTISNYKKIIAEVLLQRTKAETIANFYNEFIDIYPSWKSISEASIDKLAESLKPIGLYNQRAYRLRKLSNEMVRRGGRFPAKYEELSKIPMLGQYISNAVMTYIHGEKFPLLDVNMARVLERFFGPRELKDIRYDNYLQNLSFLVISHKKTRELNWAILDFASKVCKARNPGCEECEFKDDCFYHFNR